MQSEQAMELRSNISLLCYLIRKGIRSSDSMNSHSMATGDLSRSRMVSDLTMRWMLVSILIAVRYLDCLDIIG